VVGPGGCIPIIVRAIEQIQVALPGLDRPDVIEVEFEIVKDCRDFVPETFLGFTGKAPALGLRMVLGRLQLLLPLVAAESDRGCQETNDTENDERDLHLEPDRGIPYF
jgi:hypothetical protein